MVQKDFKSLDDQIAILKSRGLSIPDETAAKQFLYQKITMVVLFFALQLAAFSSRALLV